jgi:preprotein translocase subunit SecF
MENENFNSKFGKFHDKHYKTLLLIPCTLLIFSFVYMFLFYSNHHDIIYKDISLTGGTSVTLYSQKPVSELEADLPGKLEEVNIRKVYDLITNEQKAVIIETKTPGDQTKKILEDYLGYKLTSENSSFEFTGAALSESFYKQLLIALLIAFLGMAMVVFLLFRTFVPSAAVIISAFADILMTLVSVNLLGINVSTAGIIAFLMLIGYSVDTDMLLTTRMIKRNEGSLNQRIFEAFKTGTTMTLTALVAVVSAFFIVRSFSAVLSQIFLIVAIGLGFDILNTWVTNVSILKWYMEKKNEPKKIKWSLRLILGLVLMLLSGIIFLKSDYFNFWLGVLSILSGIALIFEPLIKKYTEKKK